MTETLQERIMRHEGFRSLPYQDTLNHWTVGFGHLLSESSAQEYEKGISTKDALDLLDKDIEIAKLAVARELPWTLGIAELKQEILQEMCFQLGINGLLGFHKMLSCARAGDDDGVVSNMLDSIWHKQTPSRCEELAALWLNNQPKE